jgi:hypothetical protein
MRDCYIKRFVNLKQTKIMENVIELENYRVFNKDI